MKAQLQAELAAAPDDGTRENITAAFAAREKALEHDIDHKPMETHLTLEVSYNVSANLPSSTLCQPLASPCTLALLHSCSHTHTPPLLSTQFLSK